MRRAHYQEVCLRPSLQHVLDGMELEPGDVSPRFQTPEHCFWIERDLAETWVIWIRPYRAGGHYTYGRGETLEEAVAIALLRLEP